MIPLILLYSLCFSRLLLVSLIVVSIAFVILSAYMITRPLIFLAAPNDEKAEIELTYNWDGDDLGSGSRNFGHLAYRVSDIYETCQRLKNMGVTISRPPRDGHMAFVRSPDNISIEILQEGNLEPKEPWVSMKNIGEW